MDKRKRNDAQKFWSLVAKGEDDECWEWQGYKFNGYGVFPYKGRQPGAHRVSYELTYGPIPRNLVIMHHCDNRSCVNPKHLEAVTPRQNVHDMLLKGRAGWQKEVNHPAGTWQPSEKKKSEIDSGLINAGIKAAEIQARDSASEKGELSEHDVIGIIYRILKLRPAKLLEWMEASSSETDTD